MKTERFIIGVGISLAVVILLSICGTETVSAQECKLIKVTKSRQPTIVSAVDPETMMASSGDCIFWANLSVDQIKVRFKGSEECVVNPVGFDCEGSKKDFITGYFGQGESRSLQIVKAGTYQYEIRSKTEHSAKTTGVIIVE